MGNSWMEHPLEMTESTEHGEANPLCGPDKIYREGPEMAQETDFVFLFVCFNFVNNC